MTSGKRESSDEEQPNARETNSGHWKRLWAFRALAISLSLIVCVLTLEVVLRIWGPEYHRIHTLPIYDSNPRGYFEELGVEDGVKWYTVYDHYSLEDLTRLPYDMRPEEREAFKTRETDILALGDSFTYGRGVRYDDTYLRQLEELLARDGHPLQINNRASAGYSLGEIAQSYLAARQPGRFPLVLYGFVLNDFGLPGAEKIVGSDYIDLDNGGKEPSLWRERSALVNFIGHHLDTIRTDRTTKKAYLAAFDGENGRAHFSILADLNRQVKADGGRLVIVLFPLFYRFDHYPFQGVHDKMAAFCRQEGVPLLDLLPAYSRYNPEDLWVHPTDHHPNEIAHRIAAEELYAYLKRENLLPPSRGSSWRIPASDGSPSTK